MPDGEFKVTIKGILARLKNEGFRGVWVVQSGTYLALDFNSGHDLIV